MGVLVLFQHAALQKQSHGFVSARVSDERPWTVFCCLPARAMFRDSHDSQRDAQVFPGVGTDAACSRARHVEPRFGSCDVIVKVAGLTTIEEAT
ncbi:MAG: hypothetical protein IPP18_11970 [Rhodocyclaceae bacterium]|nr:hypothetical protein [Rhodocyclaceae bacterium]